MGESMKLDTEQQFIKACMETCVGVWSDLALIKHLRDYPLGGEVRAVQSKDGYMELLKPSTDTSKFEYVYLIGHKMSKDKIMLGVRKSWKLEQCELG